MAITREQTIPDREPTHPGEYLKDWMEECDFNQTELAEMLNVPRPNLNRIINKKAGVSPTMALKLAAVFDTSPTVWTNLDQQYKMWEAKQDKDTRKAIESIKENMA